MTLRKTVVLALAVLLVATSALAIGFAQRSTTTQTTELVPKTFNIRITAPDGDKWRCPVNAELVVVAQWDQNNEPTGVQIVRSARDPNNPRNTLYTTFTIDPSACTEL